MTYAVDLSTGQSSRTLEQAVRNQATVLIEPRMWIDGEGLKGRLVAADAASIAAHITETPVAGLGMIVGMYCDAAIVLGRDRFLLSTFCRAATESKGEWRVELARPERLQVQQRRRFWRVQLARPSEVRVRWEEKGTRGRTVGQLYNISGEGMACMVMAEPVASLSVGDALRVSFRLPDVDRVFEMGAVLCSKTPAAAVGGVILGMQFLEPASTGQPGPAKDLHELLLKRYGGGITEPLAVEAGGVLG